MFGVEALVVVKSTRGSARNKTHRALDQMRGGGGDGRRDIEPMLVVRAEASDVPDLAETLAHAYRENPLLRWMFGARLSSTYRTGSEASRR